MSLKTHKATAKRFRVTKTGKIIKKRAGQDHFNSRESGNTTRNKRRLIRLAKADHVTVRQNLPYNS